MMRSRVASFSIVTVPLLLAAACSRQPAIDWSADENFFLVEKSEKTPEGAQLEFHSLVDAPAPDVYRALAEVENYASFVDGVSATALVSANQNIKIVNITQTVIGRQTRAQVKWTLHPEDMKVEFETVQSDSNYNDGSYHVIASPDGKRSCVISVFHVKEKGAPQNVPIGVLQSATRESFAKAAQSVKRRALGQAK